MLPILNDTFGPQIPESSARKIFDSIVRIEVDQYKATGFFLRIKIRDRQLYCLVTNDHVIPKEYVTLKKVIFLFYGKKENEIMKKIRLDSSERFIRCFCKPKDITVVEIKNYDYIPEYKFLEPDLDYKSGYNQYLYKKYYLAGYPAVEQYHQDERHISSGLITNIGDNYFEFLHSLDRRDGSSGSPICLLSNDKVVGVHKANRYKNYFIKYSINYATFIGVIIDELDDEYYLLPKINIIQDTKYDYGLLSKGLTHSKTQNFFDINSIFNFSPFSIFDSMFTPKLNIESKSLMNMNVFDFDFDFGFGGMMSTTKSKTDLLTFNDNFLFSTKKEKKLKITNYRSKTPISHDYSLFNNYNNNYKNLNNHNYNNYTSRKSSIRKENKSYEPKLKNKKKNKKKKKNKNSNIQLNKNMYNIQSYINKKDQGIIGYSNISNYKQKSSYCDISFKQERYKTSIGMSRNYCSYTSKSYDSTQRSFQLKIKKNSVNISTIKSHALYYENNYINYSSYSNYK